jgi:hypothetical protein
MIKENVEFEIGGKKRGWRFGPYSLKFISKTTGVSNMKELFKRLAEEDIEMMLAFYYACAVTYSHHKGEKEDYNEVDVSEWVEEIGFDKVNEYTQILLKQYVPKNLNPPETQKANPGETLQSMTITPSLESSLG